LLNYLENYFLAQHHPSHPHGQAITVVAFSLAGAIGTFAILRDTMDVIWEVKTHKIRSFTSRVRQRIGPFILVLFWD